MVITEGKKKLTVSSGKYINTRKYINTHDRGGDFTKDKNRVREMYPKC